MSVTPLHPAEPADQLPPTDLPAKPGGEPGELTSEAPLVLELVDPRTLVLEANVRADARLDKQFLASIRDRGVLVPIVAHRATDGLRVLYGQRRTLAAVEAGRAEVPVYVVDVPDGNTAREVGRIVDQLTENDHRTDLRDFERVAAFEQLSMLGLTATQIARRTHRKVGAVRTGLAVAGSELAAAALGRYDLTLDQAGVLAEFDGDTEAVKALTVAAVKDPGQFEHLAQRLRDKRAAAAARDTVAAELAAAGVPVVPEPPYGQRTVAKLDHLQAVDAGDAGDALSAEAHASCPGHAAFLRDRGAWGSAPEVVAVFVCTDWRAHGHRERLGSPLTGLGAGSSAGGGPMSEEQKAERRVVVANNKAWDSARTVRQRWLTAFLARRTPPKDAAQWTAVALASRAHEVRRAMEDSHATALRLLGLAEAKDGVGQWRPYSGVPHLVAVAAGKATPPRAQVLTLGLLLGGLESSLDRGTWRSATAEQKAYFTALRDWGYELSEVEQLVLTPTPDPELPTPGRERRPGRRGRAGWCAGRRRGRRRGRRTRGQDARGLRAGARRRRRRRTRGRAPLTRPGPAGRLIFPTGPAGVRTGRPSASREETRCLRFSALSSLVVSSERLDRHPHTHRCAGAGRRAVRRPPRPAVPAARAGGPRRHGGGPVGGEPPLGRPPLQRAVRARPVPGAHRRGGARPGCRGEGARLLHLPVLQAPRLAGQPSIRLLRPAASRGDHRPAARTGRPGGQVLPGRLRRGAMGHRRPDPGPGADIVVHDRRCAMTAGTAPGSLLVAARAAASRGWPVFPLQPYGKRPAVRDWPHRATCDPDQLTVWWARRPYNVGIACGPAGLLVVDLDPGADLRLPATYAVATPRGQHHYFAVPVVPVEGSNAGGEDYRRRVRASGRTTAGALGPRIDTRAAGGYVVAAGSVGRVGDGRVVYRMVSAPEVDPAPGWLLEALVPPRPPAVGERLARPVAYAQTAVDREAAEVRDAEPGTRNSRLFGAAVRLGQLAAAGLLCEADVTAVLLQASDRHVGVDGFTAAEAARAVANGLTYGRRRPRRLIEPVEVELSGS